MTTDTPSRVRPGRTIVTYPGGTVGLVSSVEWPTYRYAEDIAAPPHPGDVKVRKLRKAGGWSRRVECVYGADSFTIVRDLTDDEVAALAAADAKAAAR